MGLTNESEVTQCSDRMQQIYSEKYGLANSTRVSAFKHIDVEVDSNRFSLGNVIPMHHSCVGNTSFSQWDGSGSALTIEKGKQKAYGEFIERYCATNFKNDHDTQILIDSYDNLAKKEHCLDFRELIHFEDHLYATTGFPYYPYSDKALISWVKGINLLTGRDTWIPAQKVFLGFQLSHGEEPYIQWMSTGLACGSSYSQAANGGIYEVIERDSFMLTWLLKLPGVQIVMDSVCNPLLKKLYNHMCKYLVGEDELLIYDISRTSGVYTILTIIRNNNPSSFGLIVSAASHVNAEMAVLKSLEELCQTQAFAYEKLVLDKNKLCQVLNDSEVTDLHKHTLYYSTGARASEIDFISASNIFVKLSEMKEFSRGTDEQILMYLTSLFQDTKHTIYLIDVTRREIRDNGFVVVRAIISGYNDLDVSHQFRLLKNERLMNIKGIYGTEINNAPHPFP